MSDKAKIQDKSVKDIILKIDSRLPAHIVQHKINNAQKALRDFTRTISTKTKATETLAEAIDQGDHAMFVLMQRNNYDKTSRELFDEYVDIAIRLDALFKRAAKFTNKKYNTPGDLKKMIESRLQEERANVLGAILEKSTKKTPRKLEAA
jgi:hypothetical protein